MTPVGSVGAAVEVLLAVAAEVRGGAVLEAELWSPETFEPLAGGWPVIEVDTAGEVDPVALADNVRQAAR